MGSQSQTRPSTHMLILTDSKKEDFISEERNFFEEFKVFQNGLAILGNSELPGALQEDNKLPFRSA